MQSYSPPHTPQVQKGIDASPPRIIGGTSGALGLSHGSFDFCESSMFPELLVLKLSGSNYRRVPKEDPLGAPGELKNLTKSGMEASANRTHALGITTKPTTLCSLQCSVGQLPLRWLGWGHCDPASRSNRLLQYRPVLPNKPRFPSNRQQLSWGWRWCVGTRRPAPSTTFKLFGKGLYASDADPATKQSRQARHFVADSSFCRRHLECPAALLTSIAEPPVTTVSALRHCRTELCHCYLPFAVGAAAAVAAAAMH